MVAKSNNAAKYQDEIAEVLKKTRPRLASTHKVTFKKCFGAIAGYVDDNIFISAGRFGLALKLPRTTINRLMTEDGASHLKYFPKGHIKRDYVVLPRQIIEHRQRLKRLVDQSIRLVMQK